MRYIICPNCKTKNQQGDVTCKTCNRELVNITPIEEMNISEENEIKQQSEDKTLIVGEYISLLGDGFSIKVKSGDIIGREGVGTDILKNFKTVSRKHIKIYKENGKWFIEDVGSTNGTFVNNRPITPYQKVEIKNGDTINLSSELAVKVKL